MADAAHHHKTFTFVQAQLLKLLLMNIQLKFEKLRLQMGLNQLKKKDQVADCISFAGRIIKQRTLKGLIKTYNVELPLFFGF